MLSSHALDALKEFYADRDARAKQFEQLKAEAENKAAARGGSGGGEAGASTLKYPLSMEAFTEDWNESQFWVRVLSTCLFVFFLGWSGFDTLGRAVIRHLGPMKLGRKGGGDEKLNDGVQTKNKKEEKKTSTYQIALL